MDHAALAVTASKLYKSEGYVLAASRQTFAISTRLPSQLTIRQRAMQLHILHELSEVDFAPKPQDAVLGPQSGGNLFIEVKEILKYLLAERFAIETGLEFETASPLTVSMQFEHEETTNEYIFLTRNPAARFKVTTQRQKVGKGVKQVIGTSADKILMAVDRLAYKDFASASLCPPPAVQNVPVLKTTELMHAPIYVAGRYLKLQRHISNSPWEIKGKRITEHSVEELVSEKVDKLFHVDSHKFYSSGREDADVLMLGRGRPYYLELINPRRAEASQEEMTALQQEINRDAGGKVEVHHVQLISREETKVLKDAASSKSKSYSTLVKLASPVSLEALAEISLLKDIEVKQQNPTRVPRRADLLRDKVIEKLHVYPATPVPEGESAMVDEVRVDLTTSAGTYVKEFMHGDTGRTKPNLKDLLKVQWATVTTLDVLEIHLDWPAVVEDAS
ncbi:putative tRNA pseudouridine synthase Pus10 [Thoreauomyces humboldtii]|nr:putative tRNA pseudouridine synthase Pus10 [Thoreauomyces humboldtii]